MHANHILVEHFRIVYCVFCSLHTQSWPWCCTGFSCPSMPKAWLPLFKKASISPWTWALLECHQRLREQKRHFLYFPVRHLFYLTEKALFASFALSALSLLRWKWPWTQGCSQFSWSTSFSIAHQQASKLRFPLCEKIAPLRVFTIRGPLEKETYPHSRDCHCWLLCWGWIIPCFFFHSMWNIIISPAQSAQKDVFTLFHCNTSRLWV